VEETARVLSAPEMTASVVPAPTMGPAPAETAALEPAPPDAAVAADPTGMDLAGAPAELFAAHANGTAT
jgi:hypothetical protein